MRKKNLISIILPVYNGEKFLLTAIKSCLEQTHRDLELLIVNDKSTDSSGLIAVEIAKLDKRVKVIHNSKNLKLPASLNIGHQFSVGEFITWISHDNIYEPHALQELFKKLLEEETDIVYSDMNIISESGDFRKRMLIEPKSSLLLGNTIGGSFLYRREVYDRNGGYDESLHTVEDFDFWLQASKHSSASHLPQILYNFRSHKDSLTSNLRSKGALRSNFDYGLRISYKKYFSSFGFLDEDKYAEIFSRLHQYEQVDILNFFGEFDVFKENMKKVCNQSFLTYEDFLEDLDLRIRANIQQYSFNQNVPTILAAFQKRPQMLLNYDRRNSFKMVMKAIKITFG